MLRLKHVSHLCELKHIFSTYKVITRFIYSSRVIKLNRNFDFRGNIFRGYRLGADDFFRGARHPIPLPCLRGRQ